MSFTLAGGSSGALQEVDATPLAARVILYDSAGNPLQPTPSCMGVSLINVRQSAATAAGAAVWGIYNSSSTVRVVIQSVVMSLFFDGTAAATLMRYELIKMTGITVFSGGTVVTPSFKRTSLSGALVSQGRVLDTGLTTTSGTAQAAMWNGTQGRVTQTTTNFSRSEYSPPIATQAAMLVAPGMELAQNEALLLRQTVASVIGDNVVGSCEFFEYTP